MSLLWAVAPVAVAVGAGAGVVWLRRIGGEVDGLREEIVRLGEVRTAAEDLRSAVDGTLAGVTRLRGR